MTHINQRRDFAATWAANNPILQLGEVGWERDTRKAKLGDGTTPWNLLPYAVQGVDVTSVNGKTGAVVLDKYDIDLDNVDNTSDINKPVSTAQQAALNLKAPLASPTFTGDPKAPTPPTADNDTSIATTAFVKAQGYAPLVSPVLTGDPKAPTPPTADNDTSIATTAFVKAQGYAPIASPTFVGDPKAPTPPTADNDTSVATTAFVKSAIASIISWGRISRSSVQSLAASTEVPIVFTASDVSAAEVGGGMLVDTSGFTVPADGPYLVTTIASFAAAGTTGSRILVLVVNGATRNAYATPVVGNGVGYPLVSLVTLLAGDKVTYNLYQSSGGVINTHSQSYPGISISRIG